MLLTLARKEGHDGASWEGQWLCQVQQRIILRLAGVCGCFKISEREKVEPEDGRLALLKARADLAGEDRGQAGLEDDGGEWGDVEGD